VKPLFAAPQTLAPAPVGGVSELVHVALALLLVLTVLLLLARVLRRTRAFGAKGAGALEILAELPLGTKERAVLLRIGAQQLLIGVAPGRVSALHLLSEPLSLGSTLPAEASGALTFQALLRRSLGV
jgi:flagellar protein FliO/FliZ